MAKKDSEKKGGLDSALEALQKTYGVNSVARLKDMEPQNTEFYDSGSIYLNHALGGGYAKGRIIEIYGPESSGKTTLTLHAVAEVQKGGGNVGFIDAEHAFDPDYAKAIGVDIEALIFSQPDSGEQALEITHTLIKTGEVDLLVIDSVSALTPKREIDGEMGDATVGVQAKMMAQAMRKIVGDAKKNGCTVIFINQIRYKIGVMMGSPETTSGGQALKFAASQRIDIRRTGSIKENSREDAEVIANTVKIKIVKNKVAAPFKIAHTRIGFGKGLLYNWEILNAAIDLDIVKQGGSWFSYGDTKLGQGEMNVVSLMDDNPELCDELLVKIQEAVEADSE